MPLDVGTEAPDFTLRNQNNEQVTLSSFRGDRSVLLVFYPFAFTGICSGELCQLRDDLGAFDNENVTTLAISTDTPFSLKTWADREGFRFNLLSDFWPHGAVAKSYGVFNERAGMANRGTFLIDTTGTIRFAEMNEPGQARDQNAWKQALAALPV
jgi:peroxiredoxin (alkyl hydroperoxide reductase subunit C)